MSSDGDVWIALTTCNTDSEVLMLFMTYLAIALTKEAADWRNSTLFLLDGVSKFSFVNNYILLLGVIPQV